MDDKIKEIKKRKTNSLNEHELSNDELLALIVKCTNFAAVKHSKQRRFNKEQTPYINHPIGE